MLAPLMAPEFPALGLTILEVGARPAGEADEPFHALPGLFPRASILALEPDARLCETLNRTARAGMRYLPQALGRRTETRPFYLTRSPLCNSLYSPDPKMIERYSGLEAMTLESVSSVTTAGLDELARGARLRPDFIKIDVQGAELEIFEGGPEVMSNVLGVVTEVGFVRLYVDQPLFGDVQAALGRRGLGFHRFLGFGGRALRPTVVDGDEAFPMNYLWADALFLRDVDACMALDDEALIRCALLADLYSALDYARACLDEYDQRHGTAWLRRYDAVPRRFKSK